MHPKSHRPGRLVAVAAGLALLAACGQGTPAQIPAGIQPGTGQSLAGSPGSTATGPTSPMPTMSMPTASSAAPPAQVGGEQVTIKNFAFSPAELVVKVGTTVTWTNQDADPHTVTGAPLQSAALNTGQTYIYTFKTIGTYSYLCTIHPFMTAKVTVTK